MKEKLSNVRPEFDGYQLDFDRNDPLAFAAEWIDFVREKQVPEFNAMNLSTVSSKGEPSSRIVYLKDLDSTGLTFFTNYGSSKGKDMEVNPVANLHFFWREVFRQVQITGTVEKLSDEANDAYFNSRPRGSQIGAHASKQSEFIQSYKVLEERVEALTKEFEGKDVPRPSYWGGYRLVPTKIEFWQGRPSRLHQRMLFELINGDWEKHILNP